MVRFIFIASAIRFAGKNTLLCMHNGKTSLAMGSSQRTLKEFTTHGIRIRLDITRNALTMSSTGRTTRSAECIPEPKRKNDAQLYFADTSTCYRAVEVHEVAPNPMTFTAAMQIPIKDRMGKAEAWRQLSQRDDALIDVTEHDTFKWWLFLSNLGPNTPNAFGSGITSVQIHKRENMIGLRTEHTDSAVQWVILASHRDGIKTRLATSFQ